MRRTAGVFALLDVEERSSYQGVFLAKAVSSSMRRVGSSMALSACLERENGKGGHGKSCLMHLISLFQFLKEISIRHKEITKFKNLILLNNVLLSPAFLMSPLQPRTCD